MMDVSVLDLLATAEAAADAAAALLQKEHRHMREGHDVQVTLKGSPMDPVSTADIAAQELMVSIIQKSFPSHRILAEEEGADLLGDAESPYVWIIDPIDGTRNFVRGKPNFGTIIAVEKNGELLASCMVLPLLDQRFTAAKGQGAFVNGRPVTLRKTENLAESTVCSNITRRAQVDANGILRTALPACASLENYGCAAQSMGDILLGWNDAVLFRGLKMWDVAAGALMIEEAGGKCRIEKLDPKDPRSDIVCVASTAPIFDELCTFAFKQKLA